jgi:spore maturation protein CgeB
MKVLLAHGYNDAYPDYARLQGWLDRLRAAGFMIDDFYTGMQVRGMRLPFAELDHLWRTRDRTLLETYDRLAQRSEAYDVLVNFGGVNLHPDFLGMLNTVNVFRFSDDPESSKQFSKPVAGGHDVCAVANIAEVDTYRGWGVKHAYWVPNGFWHDEYDPAKTEDEVLSQRRDVDMTMLGERTSTYRRRDVDRYSLAFPQGIFRGRGWPEGFLPESEKIPLLQRTKIGFNKHNSTGPINYRTFYLPANGVMQICDNKQFLGQIFELGREVVGYETIDEAIDLTRYYLAHADEREAIARAGYRRAVREYNEIECHRMLLATVTSFLDTAGPRTVREPAVLLAAHTAAGGALEAPQAALFPVRRMLRKLILGGWRRATFALSVARLRALRAVRAVVHER